MGRRNYYLLLASQYLSAFGDNAVLAVILGQLMFLRDAGTITPEHLRLANAIYTTLLFVPYVLLAPVVGWLNDRYPKTRCLRWGNALKLAGVAICMLSIRGGAIWQGIGYFIVGVGACLYSPAKYGILPEVVPRERLVKANGTVELLTLVAILSGMLAGGKMIDSLSVTVCYTILIVTFALSYTLNHVMSRTPSNPDAVWRESAPEFFKNFSALVRSPRLVRILAGTALFWICGAMIKMNFQPWGFEVLELKTNTAVAMLGLWLSIGIMIGSVLAGQVFGVGQLKGTRPTGFVLAALIGLIGLVEWMKGRGWIPGLGVVVIVELILAGCAAGLFLIPLNAALQAESHQDKLGKTIATQNFIDNIGMIAGGGLVVFSIKMGFSSSGVFFFLAALIAVVVYLLRIPPLPGTKTPTPQAAEAA